MSEFLKIRAGRYERLRHAVACMARDAQTQSDQLVLAHEPDSLEVIAGEDDADEWALLLHEIDEAAPAELRRMLTENDR